MMAFDLQHFDRRAIAAEGAGLSTRLASAQTTRVGNGRQLLRRLAAHDHDRHPLARIGQVGEQPVLPGGPADT